MAGDKAPQEIINEFRSIFGRLQAYIEDHENWELGADHPDPLVDVDAIRHILSQALPERVTEC